MAAFHTSQSCFDKCSVYYGDRFEDCLKQVAVVYLDLNLSQVTIYDTVPLVRPSVMRPTNLSIPSRAKQRVLMPRSSLSLLLKVLLLLLSRLLRMAPQNRTFLPLMLTRPDFYPSVDLY